MFNAIILYTILQVELLAAETGIVFIFCYTPQFLCRISSIMHLVRERNKKIETCNKS